MGRCKVCKKEMTRANGCVGELSINGEVYPRIVYSGPGRCGDCGAKSGYMHHWGCDDEKCPVCGGQLATCKCKDVKLVVTT